MNAGAVSVPRKPPHGVAEEPASELESHVGYWLRYVSNHVSQSFQKKMGAAGVTVSEWVVMREMRRLGPTSPSELGQKIGMTKGAISKLVARLENKGLLNRSIVEADRRNHVIELTLEGRTLVPSLARLADENDAAFFGHMPELARRELIKTMKEIVRIRQLKTVPID